MILVTSQVVWHFDLKKKILYTHISKNILIPMPTQANYRIGTFYNRVIYLKFKNKISKSNILYNKNFWDKYEGTAPEFLNAIADLIMNGSILNDY